MYNETRFMTSRGSEFLFTLAKIQVENYKAMDKLLLEI